MGTNSYLYIKTNYKNSFGTVQKLKNGYVYNDKFYPTIEEVNKDFYQVLHIGKSSGGWHYLLCTYPQYNINTLEDWKKLFFDPKNYIKNEYGEKVSPEEMLDSITNRGKDFKGRTLQELEKEELAHTNAFNKAHNWRVYDTYDDWLFANSATRGKNGLWQHTIHVIPTEGTYDYYVGRDDFA